MFHPMDDASPVAVLGETTANKDFDKNEVILPLDSRTAGDILESAIRKARKWCNVGTVEKDMDEAAQAAASITKEMHRHSKARHFALKAVQRQEPSDLRTPH
ncbi:hypothetical protein VKT23_011074 [Stygiomarasmius scandens]|uniref:Uncharacterized protein n=1 Tax=Marasmiellus scandens TaxID=2682957 RepID=A0ABR1JCH2_9AGAR